MKQIILWFGEKPSKNPARCVCMNDMTIPTKASGAISSLLILNSVMLCLLITGCASHRQHISASHAIDNAQQAQTSPQSVPLFVHLISPRYYGDPPIPPKRIVTTRISIGKDFAVSFGDSRSSYSYSVGGPNLYSYSGDAVLAGRVEQRGARFFAHLLGRSHTTVNRFEGEMEAEKAVEPQSGDFSGGIWSVRFVLSTNSDCSLFLKE